MPILLYRVDDRLIHGQVVVGWGNRLRPDRYIVVDDALAGSAWEREIYALGVPEGAESEFHTVSEAREHMGEWRSSPSRTILLTRDLKALLALSRGGLLSGHEVNLGGIHHRPGRQKTLSYLYLDPADIEKLKALRDEGVHLTAQDLPGTAPVGLDQIVAKVEEGT